jgi:hypothetical protein
MERSEIRDRRSRITLPLHAGDDPFLPSRDQTEMHGSMRGSIEKYNPETIDRHSESAGAMRRPRGSRRAAVR